MTAPTSMPLDEIAARLARLETTVEALDVAATAAPAAVEEIAARVARLETTVDALDAVATKAAFPASPADSQPVEAGEPVFPDLPSFVEQYIVPTFARPLGGEFRWCTHWWDHIEAVLRLEALWRSWESLRLDPQTGMGVWLRDYADHQIPRIMAPTGPFARCQPDRHDRPHEPDRPLPVVRPPAGWPDNL